MSENRVDRAIADVNEIVLSNLRRYEAEADSAKAEQPQLRTGIGRIDRAIGEAEVACARAERAELSASDKAYLNSLIDEQREQDRLADEDYADRMLERMDEDRFDR